MGEEPPGGDDRICLFVDTNVWRGSNLLRSHIAAALLFTVERLGIRMALPYVVEIEVLKHGLSLGRSSRDTIRRGLNTLRALTGSAPDFPLPTDEELTSSIEDRLAALDRYLVKIPFGSDTALRALRRVNDKKPPAHTSQQFKDAVIWEHVVDLSGEYEQIHLITKDKAFFEQGNLGRGLESRLKSDVSGKQVKVYAHGSIPDFLRVVGTDKAIVDAEEVGRAISNDVFNKVRSSVERSGFLLQDPARVALEALVTEDPTQLAVTFSLTYGVVPNREDLDSSSGIAIVSGQCLVDHGSTGISEVELERIQIEQPPGVPGPQHVFLGVANSISGTRWLPHEIREVLPGGGDFDYVWSDEP